MACWLFRDSARLRHRLRSAGSYRFHHGALLMPRCCSVPCENGHSSLRLRSCFIAPYQGHLRGAGGALLLNPAAAPGFPPSTPVARLFLTPIVCTTLTRVRRPIAHAHVLIWSVLSCTGVCNSPR